MPATLAHPAKAAGLADRLQAIVALAEVARTALPVGRNSIFVTSGGTLEIAAMPPPSRLHFTFEGLVFHVAVNPGENVTQCQIWAEVGHIPFTAQSPERRRDLLVIIGSTRGLARARFVISEGQKILVISETQVDGPITPEALFHEIVLLMQEARPYLRLLVDYLQ